MNRMRVQYDELEGQVRNIDHSIAWVDEKNIFWVYLLGVYHDKSSDSAHHW